MINPHKTQGLTLFATYSIRAAQLCPSSVPAVLLLLSFLRFEAEQVAAFCFFSEVGAWYALSVPDVQDIFLLLFVSSGKVTFDI